MDVAGQLQALAALFPPTIKNRRLSGPQKGIGRFGEDNFLLPAWNSPSSGM